MRLAQILLSSLLTLGVLSGCASGQAPAPDAPARTLETGVPATLSVGDRATLPDGALLVYQGIVNDSRCKPGVQCVWAGDAEARFSYQVAGGAPVLFSVHTQLQPRTKTLGANTLHLTGVDWNTPPRVTVELK